MRDAPMPDVRSANQDKGKVFSERLFSTIRTFEDETGKEIRKIEYEYGDDGTNADPRGVVISCRVVIV